MVYNRILKQNSGVWYHLLRHIFNAMTTTVLLLVSVSLPWWWGDMHHRLRWRWFPQHCSLLLYCNTEQRDLLHQWHLPRHLQHSSEQRGSVHPASWSWRGQQWVVLIVIRLAQNPTYSSTCPPAVDTPERRSLHALVWSWNENASLFFGHFKGYSKYPQ